MRRDQVLSIGTVMIGNGAIDLSQQLDCTLLHGIAPSKIANGEDPAEALLSFMAFVGDSPLLAFHTGLDDWTAHFGLQVQHHHHASADALATTGPDPAQQGLDNLPA